MWRLKDSYFCFDTCSDDKWFVWEIKDSNVLFWNSLKTENDFSVKSEIHICILIRSENIKWFVWEIRDSYLCFDTFWKHKMISVRDQRLIFVFWYVLKTKSDLCEKSEINICILIRSESIKWFVWKIRDSYLCFDTFWKHKMISVRNQRFIFGFWYVLKT